MFSVGLPHRRSSDHKRFANENRTRDELVVYDMSCKRMMKPGAASFVDSFDVSSTMRYSESLGDRRTACLSGEPVDTCVVNLTADSSATYIVSWFEEPDAMRTESRFEKPDASRILGLFEALDAIRTVSLAKTLDDKPAVNYM